MIKINLAPELPGRPVERSVGTRPIRRITDLQEVVGLFRPREGLSEEVKQRLIQIVAESGAILEGHFEVEED